jgi:hypothetical protein
LSVSWLDSLYLLIKDRNVLDKKILGPKQDYIGFLDLLQQFKFIDSHFFYFEEEVIGVAYFFLPIDPHQYSNKKQKFANKAKEWALISLLGNLSLKITRLESIENAEYYACGIIGCAQSSYETAKLSEFRCKHCNRPLSHWSKSENLERLKKTKTELESEVSFLHKSCL